MVGVIAQPFVTSAPFPFVSLFAIFDSFRQRLLPSGSPSLWILRIASLGFDKAFIACASGSSRLSAVA